MLQGGHLTISYSEPALGGLLTVAYVPGQVCCTVKLQPRHSCLSICICGRELSS